MESRDDFESLVEDILAERLDLVARYFQATASTLLGLRWSPEKDEAQTPELQFLLDHWQRLRDGAALAPAEKITPFDMRPALGHVALVDVLEEGRNGRFRLFGSKIAQRAGIDMTGQLIGDLDGGSYLARFACALHRAVFVRRLPIYAAHQPPSNVSATAWHWLILPLGENGSKAVVRTLIGMVPMAARLV